MPYRSRALGPSGKVVVRGIFPEFLDAARTKARSQKLPNASFVPGTEKEPSLEAAG